MTRLAQIARPTVALFTVIGRAHLEFLHDLEGVFRAKTEMLAEMPEDGTVIVNGDDAWLKTLRCRQRLLRYGLGESCEVRAFEPELLPEGRTRCRIRYGERELLAEVPAFGRQMVYAMLEGAAVGFALGLTDEQIRQGIADYAVVGRRGAICDTGSLTLIDDSYNANPESMRCAIDSLTEIEGRHVCILADMLEMGPESGQMHLDLGQYAKEKNVELLLCCGELGREIARGAGERARWFASTEALCEALPTLLKRGDRVLVKASRGMHLEQAAEAVKELKLP